MSGSHGDLFSEIGRLVLAANAGEAIDLDAKSEELAQRYNQLGLSEKVIARAIARSIGAIGFSMAMVSNGDRHADAEAGLAPDETLAGETVSKPASTLFPSGVRLAVLS
jgi:hypothetical protein